jgi:hypothetical protein
MNKIAIIGISVCICISFVSLGLFYLDPFEKDDNFEVFPSVEQDMGKIRNKSVTTLEYSLLNVSKSNLQIIDATTTCGCTTTRISKREVAPGERSTISIAFESRDYRGNVHARAHITYVDSTKKERKSIDLLAKGQIDPDFFVEPETLKFARSNRSAIKVKVSPNYARNFIVQNVSCDKRFFDAKILSHDTESFVIEVIFDPKEYYADAGPSHLSIETNSKDQSITTIPIEIQD